MPLIFLGGARGSGKTTLVKALKKRVPHIEHIVLAQEVSRDLPPAMFKDDYAGMRRLTPEQQYEAVSKVIKRIANSVQENPSRMVFLDGHYVSSSYIDNHESFIPCLDDNAKLFDTMIWVRIEPEEIIHRRFIRECIPRPLGLTIREYLAEGMEAKFLERSYGTKLIVCRDDEFFRAVYVHLGQYLKKPIEHDYLPIRRQVDVVLRLIRGEDPGALAQELGVTLATLSNWQQRFVAAGTVGLQSQGANGREREIAREVARLNTLVREITMSAGAMRRAERISQPTFPLPLGQQRLSAAPFTGVVHRDWASKKQDA